MSLFPSLRRITGSGSTNSEFRTVVNLTNQRYCFELTDQSNVIWTNLSTFGLTKGTVLDPHDSELSGNVSGKFQKAHKVPC